MGEEGGGVRQPGAAVPVPRDPLRTKLVTVLGQASRFAIGLRVARFRITGTLSDSKRLVCKSPDVLDAPRSEEALH